LDENMTLQRRTVIAGLVGLPLAATLPGCGGGGDALNARVRLLNVSAYPALDLYVDDDREVENVGYGAAGDYAGVTDGSVDIALTRNGSNTEILSDGVSLSSDERYTVVAYGWQGHLEYTLIREDEDEPDDDDVTALSVFNAAPDAGDLDIYLTASGDALEDATPVASTVAGGNRSSFADVDAGTYRLRITAAGDLDDLRLDVQGVVLRGGKVLNLVVAPGSSGVLVDAVGLEQRGDATAYTNTMARVRVIAAAAGNATVRAVTGSTSLLGTRVSPTIGGYLLLDAGALSVDVTVGGTTTTTVTTTLDAGTDVTLLVYGDSADPQVNVVIDDNRLPFDRSDVNMRLVNAVDGISGGLDLTLNYGNVASDVSYGEVSAFSAETPTSAGLLEVYSPLYADPLFTIEDLALNAGSVYTVYMFGTGDSPVGVLREERRNDGSDGDNTDL